MLTVKTTNSKEPDMPRIDVAVVGGGPAGLRVTEQLLDARKSPLPRFEQLRSAWLFQHGSSEAFSPTQGQYGQFLRMLCSDIPRHEQLEQWMSVVRTKCAAAPGFQFKEGCRVEKILYRSQDKSYLIRYADSREVIARKLVLAVGHTHKEYPPELSSHIVAGTNGLLRRMTRHRECADKPQEALGQVLESFTPIEGTIRIGLAGLGSTTAEVIRIIDELLQPASSSPDLHRTCPTGTPIEIRIFDPRLHPLGDPQKSVISLAREICSNLFSPKTGSTHVATLESIKRLQASGQLRAHPGALLWREARISNGLVIASSNAGEHVELSCVIDCAPFNEGLGNEHYSILKGLSSGGLAISTKPNGSRVAWVENSFLNRLAVVGAAFTPRHSWNWGTWEQQSVSVMQEFFPPTSADNPFRRLE